MSDGFLAKKFDEMLRESKQYKDLADTNRELLTLVNRLSKSVAELSKSTMDLARMVMESRQQVVELYETIGFSAEEEEGLLSELEQSGPSPEELEELKKNMN